MKKLRKVAKDLLEFYHYSDVSKETFWEVVEFDAQYIVDNRKVCSCWMCSNQRAIYGPSYKERIDIPKDEKDILGNLHNKLKIKKGKW